MLSSGDKCRARHLHGHHHGLAYIESGKEYEDAFIKFRNIDIAYVKGYKKKEFLDKLLQELRCITTVMNLEEKYEWDVPKLKTWGCLHHYGNFSCTTRIRRPQELPLTAAKQKCLTCKDSTEIIRLLHIINGRVTQNAELITAILNSRNENNIQDNNPKAVDIDIPAKSYHKS
ncbi:hypothetical protein JTB14_010579 [Gonioctena quinquepunctata]|nr:hypothetical protein JTB14_010579 [Gonioctena quinquepunctata]